MKNSGTVLFLGKRDDAACREALEFTQSNFEEVHSALGVWGEPFDEALRDRQFDYVISYLSRWVVPAPILSSTRKYAINFHPASPDYPGIGCNNFALYDWAPEYGVTCHFMAPKVDTGGIVATKRFPIFDTDDVKSLLTRTYTFQLALFYEVMSKLLSGEELVESGETWGRKPYTRAEFDQLGKITSGMDENEIRRRVRATKFNEWGPTIEVAGLTFKLK